MNKTELVSIVAEKNDVTRKVAEEVINTLFETIQDCLVKDEKVVITGFGTFEVRTRVERIGRNPRTGADINIPQQKSPAFKAGKVLKEAVK